MPVPPYTDFMLPTLKLLSDGTGRTRRDIATQVASALGLTKGDLDMTLSLSMIPVYVSRSGWAITYLSKAGLLDRVGRGRYSISERGRSVLSEDPSHIDNKYLSRFPEFVAFSTPSRSNQSQDAALAKTDEVSLKPILDPREALDANYRLHQEELVEEVSDKISAMSPARFEKLVIQLLLKMGYGGSHEDAGKAIGGPGDGGVDGVIKEDRLGLDLIYLQAKKWKDETPVGRPEIQKFVGSLAGKHAQKGVFITTSTFSETAVDYARFLPNTKIVLIDGQQLAQLCIEHGIGVQVTKSYTLKKVDSDFFDGES